MTEKCFKLAADKLQDIAVGYGSCIATDHIAVDGRRVGYMYREEPSDDVDSGWRFFSGEESQAYVDDANNMMLYDVNTIANYDPSITPFLDAPIGAAFGRVGDSFERE